MPGPRNDDKRLDLHMAEAHVGQRREIRYRIPIEIEVSGIDRNGDVFHELTTTRNVSEWGCAFLSSIELKPDEIISVCAATRGAGELAPTRQSLFQVVRVFREAEGWLVATWKMDSTDVWGLDFENTGEQMEGARGSRKDETERD